MDEELQVEELPTQEEVEQKANIPEEPTGFEVVQDLMGVEHPDDSQRDKLQYIWDHFSKGRDRIDALEAIKRTQMSLSPPDIGESYLHKLYTYTRLMSTVRDAEREMKVYKNDADSNSVDRTR